MNVQVMAGRCKVVLSPSEYKYTVRSLLEHHLSLPSRFVQVLCQQQRLSLGKQLISTLDQPVGHLPLWIALPPMDQSLLPDTEVWQGDVAEVLYEDDHVLVVNKPSGLLVHSDGTRPTDTLDVRVTRYLRQTSDDSFSAHVHRLDKGTSGAVLYAKHALSLRTFDAAVAQHRVRRVYTAIVLGQPQPAHGLVTLAIGRDRHQSGLYRVSDTGKAATTRYQVLAQGFLGNSQISVVACELETGRTHQIRVHLTALGCPIVGDRLYGASDLSSSGLPWPDHGFALHACQLSFVHPYEATEVCVTAPYPLEWSKVMNDLGLVVATKRQ